jgi:tetratricopeptide (TPR) repeat protein
MSYSTLLRALGKLRESEALLGKAADTAVRLLGPEELLWVPSVRWSLADTLADLGKIEEAESLYRQAIATTEKTRPNTLSHAAMQESAGLLQLLMGRYEIADHMLAQAQSIMEHIGREDSAYEALLRAHYQLAVGEPSQALSTLATTTFAEGKALQRSLVADVVRARALLDLGRLDEAERVASTSLGRLKSTPEAEALEPNKADLLLSHGLALTRLGRAKEATTPLRDALAWREANLDENSPLLAESLIALAECYLSQGERAQAQSLVERAQRIHRSHSNLGEHLRSPLRRVQEHLSAR